MRQIIIFLSILPSLLFSQSQVPQTLRSQFNGNYGYTIIGNTHNSFDNWQNPPPPCQMLTSSSATLTLSANQNISAAYLYWGGIGDGTYNPVVSLNGTNYSSQSTFIGYPQSSQIISYFGSFHDVTSQIISSGNGIYNFSNFDLNPIIGNYCTTADYFSGWYLVVVYEDISLPNVQLNVYDGFNVLSLFFNNAITPIQIDNLNISSTSNAQMTYIAWNGSPNLYSSPLFTNTESISIDTNILSNAQNPFNNPFNGTNSFTGSSSSWNMDVDTYDISNFINIGDTVIDFTFTTLWRRFIQTIITSIPSELPDATVNIDTITGQDLCDNQTLAIDFTVLNVNSNDTLPAGTPISIFANNTIFLGTDRKSVV